MGGLNIPTTIKGFNIPAPSFPYIEGLPLYPFAEALWHALEERASLVGLTLSWGSDPYPATGRGFCPVESHVHDHYLILQRFDNQLERLCSKYVNQFKTISSNQRTAWTFVTLLEKAQELLGISSAEVFPQMNAYSNGRTIAPWGVQRAVMVSLLTTICLRDYGHYTIKWMNGASNRTFEDVQSAYAAALGNAIQKTETASDIGGSACQDTFTIANVPGGFRATINELTELGFQPNSNLLNTVILNGSFTFYLAVNQYFSFYAFGSPFSPGENILPVTMNNGVFYQKTFPNYPTSYTTSQGWTSNTRQGQVFGGYSSVFQYGMTWDES